MSSHRVKKYGGGIYLPVVLAVGGFGYFFDESNWASFLFMIPALLLVKGNTRNYVIILYLISTFLYSVAVTQFFDLPVNVHDVGAILLCFSIYSFCQENIDFLRFSDSFRRLILFQLMVSVVAGILLSNYYLGGSFLNFRFMGATLNPNQFALYALSTSVIIFYLNIDSVWKKYGLCLLCLAISMTSGSDAVFSAIAIVIVAGLVRSPGAKLVGMIGILVLTNALILFRPEFGGEVFGQSQVIERLNRWLFAVQLFLDYPFALLFGLGPGPYGPSFAETFRTDIVFPGASSVGGTEFHNSFIDFFVSFGILGALIFGKVFLSFNGRVTFSPLFFGLVAFSLFHVSYRHPIFWVALLFSLAPTDRKSKHGSPNTREKVHAQRGSMKSVSRVRNGEW